MPAFEFSDPTNKSVEISIGGESITLYFTFNTFSAFQKRTGKFFMSWFFEVLQRTEKFARAAVQIDQNMTAEQAIEAFSAKGLSPFEMLEIVPLDEAVALLWAGAHRIENGNVVRDFTEAQLGEMLDLESYARLLPELLRGASAAMPKRKPTDAESRERPTSPQPLRRPTSGGKKSGPSDDQILASAIRR